MENIKSDNIHKSKASASLMHKISTRVVRKVLRLCLYLKKYPSLEKKTYTI